MPNVDIDITDVRGQTPLFAAVKYNHVENVQIMCKAGANPNGSIIHSESPIHIAVRDGFHDVISVLLKYGASPDGYDDKNRIKRENFGTIPVRSQKLQININENGNCGLGLIRELLESVK